MDQIFSMVDIKNRLNVTKIGGATMGVSTKRGLQNSYFLTFLTRHMKF